MSIQIGRRGLLRGMAGALGASVGSRIWTPGTAHAAEEKSAVVVLHFVGGYNALFCSADSFINRAFGVTGDNVRDLGNGLVVDKGTIGTLPDFALKHMATIGNRHGTSDHAEGIKMVWSNGTKNSSIRLAAAMGGEAAIKCAQIRGPGVAIPSPAEAGVSLQGVNDIGSLIETLVGGDLRSPDRGVAQKALAASNKMGERLIESSPAGGTAVTNGYSSAIDALGKQAPPFDYRGLPKVYGLTGTSIVNSPGEQVTGPEYASKFCAAEVLIRAGTNVVNIFTGNSWDSHNAPNPAAGRPGNSGANLERNQMAVVIPELRKFLTRMYDPAGLGGTHNVVVVLLGDFSRSLPGNDHQPNLSVTVMGKYVKVGTTGRVAANASLPVGTPTSEGMWAYIAAMAKATGTPFGANPHKI